MKAAFKYFFLFLLFMFAGAMLISIPVLIVIFSIFGKDALGDDPAQNVWFVSMIILAGDLLVLFMFWKKRYSRFHFGISTNTDETYNYKKLYLWASVGVLGCLLLNIFVQNYVDFPEVDFLETLTGMMKNPLGLPFVGEGLESVVRHCDFGSVLRCGAFQFCSRRHRYGHWHLYGLGVLSYTQSVALHCLPCREQHSSHYHIGSSS